MTGLIRKNDLQGSQGIPVLGGRVRIGGAGVPRSPMGDPARDPAYNQVTIDVQSWRELPGSCPAQTWSDFSRNVKSDQVWFLYFLVAVNAVPFTVPRIVLPFTRPV